jgi:hypothetical protein
VNGVVRYKPAFKVDRKLKDEKGAVRVKDAKVLTLQVRVDAPESLAALISEVHRQKGKVLRADGDVASVEVRPSAIARLAQLEVVVWLEEAAVVRLQNDTARWTIQTNVNGSTRIWDQGLHGENQIVGVADTGLDHDMLLPRSCWDADRPRPPQGRGLRRVHRRLRRERGPRHARRRHARRRPDARHRCERRQRHGAQGAALHHRPRAGRGVHRHRPRTSARCSRRRTTQAPASTRTALPRRGTGTA